MVQTNVEEQYGCSKTIYADCFSLWSRGEDAGSPGGTYILQTHYLFLLLFSCFVVGHWFGNKLACPALAYLRSILRTPHLVV
ncbi:hypothetical protein BDN72DRAFT_295893 [Pluteus cervinus]|uniref:Uncharacterized protein n=1 Tax=Pluteus cervinus TaxID=181527 RepID=A0ACD3B6X7_9AGAR|nr:hypothetical protein BDN72DRAFT_295893 [Pluteus cervinus]